MSWKRIAALVGVLAALLAAIVLVNRSEGRKQESEGRLTTLASAEVARLEVVRNDRRFAFVRADNRWDLVEPIRARADRAAVENILDNFCPLKYDREVEKAPRAGDLAGYGLDKPALELRLFAKGQAKPSAVVQLGINNGIDNSAYARLGSGGPLVMIPSFKRAALEKETFDFRDKKFFELDTTQVTALAFTYDKSSFAFNRRDGRWFMDRPLVSLAQDSKLTDILSRLSTLEAKAFLDAVPAPPPPPAAESPLLSATLTVAGQTRQLSVEKRGETCYATASGLIGAVEIDKSLLDVFSRETADYRQRKVMPFYAFDVKELDYRSPGTAFLLKRGNDGVWQTARPAGARKPDETKVNQLLTALEECEAKEFVDSPSGPRFAAAATLVIKAEDLDRPGQLRTLTLELSAPQGEVVMVRDPSLPYLFKVDKAIGEKLPKTVDDLLAAEAARPAPATK